MTSSTLLRPRLVAAGFFVVASLILLSPLGITTAAARHQELPGPVDASLNDTDIPAHIAIVDGTATVERDGHVDPAIENDAVLAGDRLRTERGRVEVMFADGSTLDVDQDSDVDLLSDALMRLRAGRVRLSMLRG